MALFTQIVLQAHQILTILQENHIKHHIFQLHMHSLFQTHFMKYRKKTTTHYKNAVIQ